MVSELAIRFKAKNYRSLPPSEQLNFGFTIGRISLFQTRHELQCSRRNCESANGELMTIAEDILMIRKILEVSQDCNVVNVEEFGLHFCKLFRLSTTAFHVNGLKKTIKELVVSHALVSLIGKIYLGV